MSKVSLTSFIGEDADLLQDRSFQSLLIANSVSAMGIALFSPILDSMVDPLGASVDSIGLLMSAFTAPPILLIPISGILADRYGRKPLLIAGIVLFSTAGGLIALIYDFRLAVFLRFVQGMGFSAIIPVVITCLGDLYDGSREATAQGLRFSSSGIIQILIPLIAGLLVGISWKYPLLLFFLGLPMSILAYLWFDETAIVNSLSESPTEQHRGSSDYFYDLLEIIDRNTVVVLFLRVLPGMIWIGFITYNSIIVTRFLGLSPAYAGMLAALLSITFALTGTQTGRLASRFDDLSVPIIFATVGLGLGMIFLVLAPRFEVAAVGALSAGLGLGILLPVYRSMITGIPPHAVRGIFVSVSESFDRFILTITPMVMGFSISQLDTFIGFQKGVQIVGCGLSMFVVFSSVLGIAVIRRKSDLGGYF